MQLIAHDLTCIRGGRAVFEGLALEAHAGKGLLVTGPNGAGKSSLLRVIAGLIPPAGGTIALEGGAADTPLAEHCHYVGHLNGVKRAFTVAENLAFWANYLGGGDVDAALAAFGLEALGDIPAGLLSAGQARRLALARLALAPRAVWLLDEPTVSLDTGAQQQLAEVLSGHLDTGGIAIAATHAPLDVTFEHELALGGAQREGAR